MGRLIRIHLLLACFKSHPFVIVRKHIFPEIKLSTLCLAQFSSLSCNTQGGSSCGCPDLHELFAL